MYSGTIVPHMNSSRHRAAALRAHRCTARSPQRAPFLFQQIARLQLSSSLKLSLHTAKHRLNTDFLRIEYTKSPGNEVNSTYNMVPLHGSVHQTNLYWVVPGLESAPQPVYIPLPTSEPPRQKRTLTSCPTPVRHDALGMRPQRYAQSRERVVFTPGPDGQPVTLLLSICAKTNSLVYIGRFNSNEYMHV